MTSFLLLESGDILLLENGDEMAMEDHTGAQSGTLIAVVTTTNFPTVVVINNIYRDENPMQSIKSIQDENRLISIGEFTEWNEGTETYEHFDPTAGPHVIIKDPNGTETAYVYPTDVEIERTAVGTFRVVFDVSLEGTWYVRWYCTGTEMGSDEQTLRAKIIQTTNP